MLARHMPQTRDATFLTILHRPPSGCIKVSGVLWSETGPLLLIMAARLGAGHKFYMNCQQQRKLIRHAGQPQPASPRYEMTYEYEYGMKATNTP